MNIDKLDQEELWDLLIEVIHLLVARHRASDLVAYGVKP